MVEKRKIEQYDCHVNDKAQEKEPHNLLNHPKEEEDSDDSNVNENETIDVDFDFCDPKEIDFHGIKTLLKQLFSSDSERIDLSELADLLITQAHIGSTVKIDGDSDPYALMSVVNLKHHQEKNFVKQFKEYLMERISKKQSAEKVNQLKEILENKHVAFLVNERLVNMPVEIVPPMYKMLQEEIQWAVEDKLLFEFDYYMVISKVYQEVEAMAEDTEDNEPVNKLNKKKKKQKMNKSEETFYFQPEDQLLEQHSELIMDFKLAKQRAVAEAMSSFQDFGIEPSRRLMIIPQSKMANFLSELENSFPANQ